MKALVTGAIGFVGKYMMIELASSGYSVRGVDVADSFDAVSLDPLNRWFERGNTAGYDAGVIDYRRCDILDYDCVVSVIDEYVPDVIVHLAAQSSAARSFDDPIGTMKTNLLGTMNLFEAVRRFVSSDRVKESESGRLRILSVGSSDEYGNRRPEEMPLEETTKVDPLSPYAVSKAAQSMLARQYSVAFGLEIISTRSFNHTGPFQSERFVLPAFAKQCAEIKFAVAEPVIRTGNIDVIRDFSDVTDTVRAYRLLVEKGRAGEVYNVCSCNGLRLRDALNMMMMLTGIEAEVTVDETLLRPAELEVLVGLNEKLKRDTGWEARYDAAGVISRLVEFWTERLGAEGKDRHVGDFNRGLGSQSKKE